MPELDQPAGAGEPPARRRGRPPRRPDAAPTRQIQRSTGLVEEVYARIRADIMSVKIPPEARISVDQMARELGVSQTPVREALSMLEAQGLVVHEHFVGYCTSRILTRAQCEHLYEIRRLLEPAAAGLAATKMSNAERQALQALAHRMDPDPADLTRTGYDRFTEDDAEFHARIALGSGNPLIAESLGRLHAHLHIFRLRLHLDVTKEAFFEHGRILQALLMRDAPAAEREMRAHLDRSHLQLLQFAVA